MEEFDCMIEDMVSCIIPTYKRSDTLIRAIESVLNQTYNNIEVLVVDDNDPNDEYSLKSKNKVSALEDDRVRYIQQERHINGAVARNVGIKNANGEYIAFLDDDDEWVEDKIEKQVQYLKNNKEIDGVSCLYIVKNGEEVVRRCAPYTGENLHWNVITRNISVFTTTILLKKKSLDESGYFDEELLRHQDLQLLLDFLYDHKMGVLTEYKAILYADSVINHPSLCKMIEIKSLFFDKCQKHFERYNQKEQKEIYNAHYFEIVIAAMREKNVFIMLKYLMKIGFNVKSYCAVVKRWKDRRR